MIGLVARLMLAPGWLLAQDDVGDVGGSGEPVAASEETLDKKIPAAKPAGPDTTIWVDDNGVPRPLVGLSYDELLKAWRILEGLDQSSDAPLFTRDVVEATGLLKEDRVELTVRYEVSLPQGGRVATPLGFAGGVLLGEPKIDSQDNRDSKEARPREFVAYDDARGGFVAWLEGEAGAKRTVGLRMLLPLERDNRQVLLRANVPRASQSILTLDSPNDLPEPFASEGAVVDTEQAEGGGARVVVQGAVGDFQLGWRAPATTPSTEQETVLSAEGLVFCDIDGRRVRSRATLLVRSYGGPLERFRVRLPAGSTLIPTAASEADAGQPRVTALEAEQGPDGRPQPICLVTLAERTSAPVAVTIETEQAVGLGEQAEIDLAGFDVVDAVRQDGDVALRVAEDWRLRWGELRVAQRVDAASLAEELQQPGVTAAVKYFGQPWKLMVRIVRLGTRIEAIPHYRLEIKPDLATLTTEIDYRIPGARVSSFSIDLRDWPRLAVSPPVGPSELVDSSQVTQNEDNELYVPLLRPTSQQASVEFTATRDLSPSDETLTLRLPTAKATTQGVSELIVVVDPAVQLTPDLDRSKRLRSEPLPEGQRDPADPSGVRTFRFVGFLPDQVFAAEKRLRPGETEVAIDSRVELEDSSNRIEQTFDYVARYKPVTRVRIEAPTELVESGALSFNLLPAPGAPLTYRQGDPPEADDSRTEVIVELPRPWIGPFTIRSELSVLGGLREMDSADSMVFPLLSPLGATQASHRVRVVAEDGRPLALATALSGVTISEPDNSAAGELLLSAAGAVKSLAVMRQRQAAPRTGEAVLERVWLQTWVAPNTTQQRAAFTFLATADQATLRLPEEVINAPLEVYVDKQPAEKFTRRADRLVVPLPAGGGRHTVELRYLEPKPPATDTVGWRPVRLVANASLAEGYWEIILPADRRVVAGPEGFAAAMRWAFEAGAWTQRPTLTTEQLEAWAGATGRGRPAGSERRRLYSYYGPPAPPATAAVRTLGHGVMVLSSSGAVLAVGLLLIYLPLLRRPASLFALAVAAVAIGSLSPGWFLFAAQTGMYGLLLASFAAVLAAVLRRPDLGEVAIGASSIGPPSLGPGTDTLITLPMGTVSTNAPTVSIPPADSRGSAN